MNSDPKSIVVVGDAYAETQYFVEEIPSQSEFAIASSATSVYGSKTINASRVLARLKDKVSFVAHLGQDTDGENTIQALSDWGILSLVKCIEGEKTGKIVVITNKSGKSSITLFRGANQTLSQKAISNLEAEIIKHDAVYAATSLPLDSLYSLAEICRVNKIPLFVDVPNQHSSIDLSRLASVDFFAPNRQEAELLTIQKINTINDAKVAALLLRKSLKGTIILTLDKDGCVLLKAGEDDPQHLTTSSVDSVDETAAGDIFRAVFFHYVLQLKSIDDAVRKALDIATESTKIKGVDKTLSEVLL